MTRVEFPQQHLFTTRRGHVVLYQGTSESLAREAYTDACVSANQDRVMFGRYGQPAITLERDGTVIASKDRE